MSFILESWRRRLEPGTSGGGTAKGPERKRLRFSGGTKNDSLERNNDLLEKQNTILLDIAASLRTIASTSANLLSTFCWSQGIVLQEAGHDERNEQGNDPEWKHGSDVSGFFVNFVAVEIMKKSSDVIREAIVENTSSNYALSSKFNAIFRWEPWFFELKNPPFVL